MAIDLGQLARGMLCYSVREPALDDIRFERIVSGFGVHYLIADRSPNRFRFERTEGYPRAGRLDAFGLVDGGTVQRIAEQRQTDGNVISFGSRYGWLHFSLNLRTTFIIWLMFFVFGWFAAGGDWLFWLVAFVAVQTLMIVLVQRSLKTKLRNWLARESWN